MSLRPKSDDEYRRLASELYDHPDVTVGLFAHVSPVADGGAFVELTAFVPDGTPPRRETADDRWRALEAALRDRALTDKQKVQAVARIALLRLLDYGRLDEGIGIEPEGGFEIC